MNDYNMLEEELEERLPRWEEVKDSVVFRLVNQEAFSDESPEEEGIIFRIFLDFFVLYTFPSTKTAKSSTKEYYDKTYEFVDEEYLTFWRIDEEKLFKQALQNLTKISKGLIYPITDPRCQNPKKMKKNINFTTTEEEQYSFIRRRNRDEKKAEALILTNEKERNGATSILIPGVLHKIGEVFGDFFIIPLSPSQIMLIQAEKNLNLFDAYEILYDQISHPYVSPEDFLSDSVYRYYADGQYIMNIPNGL